MIKELKFALKPDYIIYGLYLNKLYFLSVSPTIFITQSSVLSLLPINNKFKTTILLFFKHAFPLNPLLYLHSENQVVLPNLIPYFCQKLQFYQKLA